MRQAVFIPIISCYHKVHLEVICHICLAFQLKPVRSLENFKHEIPYNSSPVSPDHWSGATFTSSHITPPLFLHRLPSQDSENLLLQSPDDVFSSPPAPPPRVTPPLPTQDLFGTSAFVVGGGRNENGDPLFYVAHQDSVDIVKLSPPVVNVSRRKVKKLR